jgi:hypothetical protein
MHFLLVHPGAKFLELEQAVTMEIRYLFIANILELAFFF